MKAMIVKAMLLIALWGIVFSVFSFTQSKGISKAKENDGSEVGATATQEKKQEHIVQVMHNGISESIPLETYLEGVVASEMPYTFELEALKAQCVAARTFVLKRNLNVDDSTSSQVYRSESELIEIHQDNYETMITRVRQAIKETESLVMRYNGEYISALFYSSNNGKSNKASWYYSSEVPYLQSVDSPWDLQFDNIIQTTTLSLSDCMNALGVASMDIGEITYYDNGYVQSIVIGNQQFSGREVREKLHLRSSCFSFKQEQGNLVITTSGYGHGVGMSQYGAQGMALEGYDFKAILNHYYTGVSIEKI